MAQLASATSSSLLAPMLAQRACWQLPAAALLALACGSAEPVPDDPLPGNGGTGGAAGSSNAGGGNAGSAGVSGGPAVDAGPGVGDCNVRTVDDPPTSALHALQCDEVTYSTNPPSGGNHYAIWAAFQTYDFPLAAGFVVHGLEHGAVVFWYNCPEGCADEVAEVQALIDAMPVDPLCAGTPVDRRAILLPYPALGSRWGVSAWGHALTADCVDAEAFGSFYTEHYAQGPEQLCNEGRVFTENPCP